MNDRLQLIDDLGAQFHRVADEIESGSKSRSRRPLPHGLSSVSARIAVLTASAVILAGGTAYAIPATRDAVGGVVGSLSGWVLGDEENPPGRAIEPGDNAPSWFEEQIGTTRVIAETDGVGLYVSRTERDGMPTLEFGIGPGMVFAGPLESWRQRFTDRAVVVLPTGAAFDSGDFLDPEGRFPLLGVTTRDIARVEVSYVDGPPLAATNGDGGFVLLVDAWRPLQELVAYDASGQVRERVDLRALDMRHLCEREPGCPATTTPERP